MLIQLFIELVIGMGPFILYCVLLSFFFRPHTLTVHNRIKRWLSSVSMGIITSYFLLWLNDSWTLAVCGGVAISWLMICFVYRAQATPQSQLVVIPSLFNPRCAEVHLANPRQAFNRQTYRELPQLLQRLSELGVENVTLTSPMFAKGDELRTLTRLKRILSVQVIRIEAAHLHWTTNPVGTLALCFAKYLQRASALRCVHITTWYQLTLTLNRTRK